MLPTFHPSDFEKDSGRKKIISFLHEVEVRVRRLEQNAKHLKGDELHMKKDIEEIFKSE
ncbi:MAG: hypothetical protein AAB758_02595 [Patescibacteria group bacterium]